MRIQNLQFVALALLAAGAACANARGLSFSQGPRVADSASRPVVFRGAKIVTMAGEDIDDGVLVVDKGKITAVGRAANVTIPANAEEVDARGKYILPGFVDTHSHIGAPAGGDSSSPIQPDCRVMDSIDVRDPGIARARAGGITTANVMPGSGHLLSGQTLYLKLRDGNAIEDLLIKLDDGSAAGGIKMANGTNSRGNPPFPGSRAKSAALVREQYIKAAAYRDKLKKANGDPEKMPERDLNMEALVEVLDGKRVVHHHTHRHDDILTVLRLQKEFGFKVVLHHVSEGWKVADEIAKANVPCSVIVIDSPGGKLEAKDASIETCGVLERAGARVAIHTDDYITDSRLFNRSAALAVRGGMSRRGALAALTIEGAKILELDKKIGSLETGKDADLAIWSGDPLSVYSYVTETWIEGKLVFDRSRARDRLVAEGGRGAGEPRLDLGCCAADGEDR
ncbi:MAG: amidohydrolase family protein [Planctomycetes bacterium]|nr:amidohydrolase family protein [Planctomycetota bacterium]